MGRVELALHRCKSPFGLEKLRSDLQESQDELTQRPGIIWGYKALSCVDELRLVRVSDVKDDISGQEGSHKRPERGWQCPVCCCIELLNIPVTWLLLLTPGKILNCTGRQAVA